MKAPYCELFMNYSYFGDAILMVRLSAELC